jgi:hypothetical protein
MATVPTALPIVLVMARASDMKRSTPRSSTMPATGILPIDASVAASVMKPEPVTPAAPFEVSSRTPSSRSWSPIDRSTPVAWAMNTAAIVR